MKKTEHYCKRCLTSYLCHKLDIDFDLDMMIDIADHYKYDYHNFKNSKLPRVEKILGHLKSLYPETILDIGFGRGKFLYPFLEEFSDIKITALERNKNAINEAKYLNIKNLELLNIDLFDNELVDKSFDIITALEVMEHIEDTEKFLDELVRISKKWLLLSVPSKEDDNPEHIHLFTKDKVIKLFAKYGLIPKFEFVLNHMIIIVKIGG